MSSCKGRENLQPEGETRSEQVPEGPWRCSSRSADGMENTGPPQCLLKGMNAYTESNGIPGAIDSLLISKEQRIPNQGSCLDFSASLRY